MKQRTYNPFLYPACPNGFIHMGIMIFLLYVGILVGMWVQTLPYHSIAKASAVIEVLVLGFFFMYLNECLLDSANGGLIAPDTLPTAGGHEELLEETTWGIVPIVFCFWPTIVYHFMMSKHDIVIYSLVMGCSIFFYPIVYLRCMVLRDTAALNPIPIVYTIIRFFPAYFSLLIGMAVVFAPMVLIYHATGNWSVTALISVPFFVYSSIVVVHLIGRFYCLRSDKLNWM